MTSIRDLLASSRRRLAAAGVERPGREAALLLRSLLDMSESALLAHDRTEVSAFDRARYATLIDSRCAGAPAAHLLGYREFWGRRFAVDDRVLVPRPETEHLIEIALAAPLPRRARVLDLGTGSGCIAVTLAAERQEWQIVATDLSPAALALARRNAARHLAPRRLPLVAADLTTALRLARFDLIVANLPYIGAEEFDSLSVEVRQHDPRLALCPQGAATSLIERLLIDALALPAGARLLLEFGATQGAGLLRFARSLGGWDPGELRLDLAGHDRNLMLTRIDAQLP